MIEVSGFDPGLITPHVIETARRLIERYDLHPQPCEAGASWPVDILAPLEKFELRLEQELPDTTWGFTLDLGHKIIMCINGTLTTQQTRYVVMHEVGHVALWHPNQLHACVEGQWHYDRLETEADIVAACVLIPHQAVALPDEYLDLFRLADRYCVPPELAAIRRFIYQRTGY